MKVCFISITIFYIKLNFIYFQILDALVKVYSSSSYLLDRKSTRLNSSHLVISYAVFCLKKKSNTSQIHEFMQDELCSSLDITNNLSSSKGAKPLQLHFLTTYLPTTSAYTRAYSTSLWRR